MIRLAFMCDAARVIGATTPEANAARFDVLPRALKGVMDGLYQTQDAVIAGAPSLFGLTTPAFVGKRRMCLSRTPDVPAMDGLEDLEVVSDVAALAAEYAGDKELLVIGGRGVFTLFLPYATRIDIAQTTELVPGDLVFDAWESEPFEEISRVDWDGGQTIKLQR